MTGDLDGYGTFSEDVIGLETTLVLGAGPGHRRQAVLAAGEVMLSTSSSCPATTRRSTASARRCSSGVDSIISASP
ncbi:MAG TPA: hypothetical protein VIT42_19165 [Microlunatus sp.]